MAARDTTQGVCLQTFLKKSDLSGANPSAVLAEYGPYKHESFALSYVFRHQQHKVERTLK